MYEKNIVGVYNHLHEYPVFQHVKAGEKQIDRVQYAAEEAATARSIRGELNEQETVDQWRQFSRQLRDQRHQPGQQNQQSAQQQPQQGQNPEQNAKQAAQPQSDPASSSRLDQLIEARVRAHIQPAQSPDVHSVHQALHVMQRHLSTVTQALPDHHENIIETIPELESDEHVGCLQLDQVMTRRVVCVRETVTLEEAASLCNRRGFSSLPVLNRQNQLLGTVSLRQLIYDLFSPEALTHFAAHNGILESESLEMLNQPVSRHLDPILLTLAPDTPLNQACRQMAEHHCQQVLVTVKGEIKGLFTSRDAVRVLASAHLHGTL